MTEPAALPRTEPELDSTTRTDQSEELATTTLLRAAIGAVNTDYYLGVFTRFDARDRVGPHWNTAAALSTLNWMVYRRMWNAALTYTGLALSVALLVFGIGKLAFHYTSELQWALALAYALVLVALPGLFGNALLFKQYRRDMALALAAHATLPQAAATLLARAPTRQRLLVLGGINILGAAALAGLGLWASAFNGMPTALGAPGAAPAAPVASGKVAVGRAVDALPSAQTAALPASASAPASAPANLASAPTTPTTPASGPSAAPAAAASAPALVGAGTAQAAASAPAAPAPVAAASSPAMAPAPKGAASAPAVEKQAATSALSATANAGRGSVHAPMVAAPQAAALAAPTPNAEKTEAARLAPQASAQQRAPRTGAASAPKTTQATAPASARKAPATPATPAARADNSASRPETATRSPATARSGPRAAGSTAAAPTAPAAPAVPAKRADAAPAPAPAAGSFGINVGLFADENNARNAMVLLGDAGLPAYTQTLRSKKGPLTRVRVGPFDSQAQAERTAEQIRALGLEALVFQQAP